MQSITVTLQVTAEGFTADELARLAARVDRENMGEWQTTYTPAEAIAVLLNDADADVWDGGSWWVEAPSRLDKIWTHNQLVEVKGLER